ncbi:hypothetical protein ACFU8W_51845 [Streptomyces sp. NPDC057565]|uniref:hypothetical protein n=1 Tax=Streptomyces sp. NPDC057565 TaxID=3346169 RepID=UPI00367B9A0A
MHSTPALRSLPNDLAQAMSWRYPSAVAGKLRQPKTAPSMVTDKLAVRYEAAVLVAAVNEWL